MRKKSTRIYDSLAIAMDAILYLEKLKTYYKK